MFILGRVQEGSDHNSSTFIILPTKEVKLFILRQIPESFGLRMPTSIILPTRSMNHFHPRSGLRQLTSFYADFHYLAGSCQLQLSCRLEI